MTKGERRVYAKIEWWTKVQMEILRGKRKEKERHNRLGVAPPSNRYEILRIDGPGLNTRNGMYIQTSISDRNLD